MSGAKIIPGPMGTLLGGNTQEVKEKGILPFYLDKWRNHGDIFALRFFNQRIVVLVHPDYVQQALIDKKENYIKGASHRTLRLLLGDSIFTAEGEHWAKERKMMRASFTMQSIKEYFPMMVRAVVDLQNRWELMQKQDTVIDVSKEMRHLTVRIICESLFGSALDTGAANIQGPITNFGEQLIVRSNTPLTMPLFIPTSRNRQFLHAQKLCLNALQFLMDTSVNDIAEGKLLLNRLKAAVNSDGDDRISPRQALDEFITMFFAGHETTANALVWTLILLDRFPSVRKKLHAELDAQLNGRTPSFEDLNSLTYTHMVIMEAMRLYPPAWIIVRDAKKSDVIGGYKIPKGAVIFLSPYLTHRHPDFWSNPDTFRPERFENGAARKTLKDGYFPFGHGPRTCIGNLFSLVEMKLALAMIHQRFDLMLDPPQEIREEAKMVLMPDKNILMKVRRYQPKKMSLRA